MSSKTGDLLFPATPPPYEPPPGPPTPRGPAPPREFPTPQSAAASSSADYAPPPGPPPSHSHDQRPEDVPPPPYHDWTSIPDTALLPPPPGLSHDFSPGFNASKDDADRAKQWCYFHPLWTPQPLLPAQLTRIQHRDLTLVAPGAVAPSFRNLGQGLWECGTAREAPDALVHTDLPLYSACSDSPVSTGRAATLYFEVRILRLGAPSPHIQPEGHASGSKSRSGLFSLRKHAKTREPVVEANEEAGLALGFFAPPYPPFRLPGWQRGSLGVHSDDGRRYVNDTHGGLDFTAPFREGETLGLGLRFHPSRSGEGEQELPSYNASTAATPGRETLDATVFFTREGKEVGTWNLHEERDLEDDPHGVEGLEGAHDLFPAVGVFGAVQWEVRLKEGDWLWRP